MTTDPRDDTRHLQQRFPKPQGQPPPPPGTDVSTAAEADALDAWLNERALASPHTRHQGGPATPTTHDAGSNGQIASARQFHARFSAAEEAESPDTPVDAIWEQIMASTNTHLEPAPALSPTSRIAGRSQEHRPARHPMLVRVGSHPAATALLVAGVILAIIFVFRAFDHDPNPPIIDYGPAAIVGNGTATPAASLTAAPCTMSELTDAEMESIVRTVPLVRSTSDFVPTQGPATNADGMSAIATYLGTYGCSPGHIPGYRAHSSLGTDRSNAVMVAMLTPETAIELAENDLAMTRALSPILANPDPRTYIVDSSDPAVAPYVKPDRRLGRPVAILPGDFVTLADGRIGAPIKIAREGGAGTVSAIDPQLTQTVQFIVFKQVDGTWLLDDQITLCTTNCDAYYAQQEQQIAATRTQYGATTPASSPASADIWLQPITEADCTTPGSSTDPHEEAAYLLRQFWGCDTPGNPFPAMSDDFLMRHPEARNGQFTLTAADVVQARAMAPVIVAVNPQLTITDAPDIAKNAFPAVFLPGNAITLADGRFAIPLTLATPLATPAATSATPSTVQPVILYIFTIVDGQPRLDDVLTTCIGDCDALWAQQSQQIGTPQPSNSMIATQAATAEARQSSPAPTQSIVSGGDNSRPTQTATSSPEAIQLSTPDENGCVIRTLSKADQESIANPAAMPTPDYAVEGPLNSETIASDATDMLSNYYACRQSQPKLAENQESGAVSNAMLATSQQGRTPDTRIPQSEQNLERDKALSAELVVQDPTLYIVDADDAAVRPWRMPHFATSSSFVMLPQDFVTFADGRIGAPLKNARPGGLGVITKDSFISPQTLQFVFFRQVDDVWMIDETATLCTWKCDEYFAARQHEIDADRAANGLATPETIASPVATASPVADLWLQPISLAECQHPYVDASLNEQAALLMRQSTACFDQGDSTTVPADQLYSAGLLRDHPELRDGQYTLTEADVANAEAIAPTVAQRDLQLYVTGIPGADDQSNRTQGFYEVFLPHPNTIDLGPARFAIPLSIAFPDEAKTQQAATEIANSKDPVTVALYVFTVEDGGTPRVDDILLTCIANCDDFRDQQRAKGGTPVPSSEQRTTEAATATASPAAEAWLQPIAANECTPVLTTTDPEYDVARDYTITEDPAPDGSGAARQGRTYTACMGWGTVTPQAQASDFATSRHATEDTRRLSTGQIAGAKALSAYYTGNGFSPYQRAPEGTDFRDAHTTTSQRADEGPIVYTPIFDPNTAVGLSDGRVAMPTTYLIADDRSWNQAERQPLPITTGLTIWANVDGTWLIDEELPLCIGDCTSLWDYLESRAPDAPSATPASPAPGTPASPVASAIMPVERRLVTI